MIGGTTGEGQLMSWDEHVMLIAHTVNAFGGSRNSGGGGNGKPNDRLLVVGNTGSNATREALHATEQGFAVGMDCSLQINPYYGKTSAAGLLRHFGAALSEGEEERGVCFYLFEASRSRSRTRKKEREKTQLFSLLKKTKKNTNTSGPGMLYNVPGRTGQDIPDEVVLSLAESHPDSFLGERERKFIFPLLFFF